MTLPPVREAIESLETHNVRYELFDRVRIEPTDTRYWNCLSWVFSAHLVVTQFFVLQKWRGALEKSPIIDSWSHGKLFFPVQGSEKQFAWRILQFMSLRDISCSITMFDWAEGNDFWLKLLGGLKKSGSEKYWFHCIWRDIQWIVRLLVKWPSGCAVDANSL